MNRAYRLSLIMIVLCALAAGCDEGGHAQENRIMMDTLFSGSGTETTIDTNGDGIMAIFVTAHGRIEGLGEINFTEAVETRPSEPVVSCTTPDGGEGQMYELVTGRLSLQIENSGDIITGEFLSDRQCFPVDPQADSEVAFEGQWIVTGGMEKFSNSTGAVDFKGSARILLSHPTGIFVIASSEHRGVIEINQ
jgi:hypothetical protein